MAEKRAKYIEEIATKERKAAILNLAKNLAPGKRIALVGHDSPDADYFGSFAAFKHYFTKVAGIEAVDSFAVFGGESILQNQVIEKFLGIDLKDQKFYEGSSELYGANIFLDTSEVHTSLKIKPDIIFDHHKESETPVDGCFTIYEAVGASCTMTYVLLGGGLGVKFPQEILVGLALGITLDTRSLQDEGTKKVDRWALKEIVSQMDEDHYQLYLYYSYFPPVSFGSIQRRGRAFAGAENENGIVFAFLGETDSSEDNSYGVIADELIRVRGAEIAIVSGIRGEKFEKVAVRVNSETLGYEKILKDVFKTDFYSRESEISSGGRSTSAGGALIPLTSFEKGQCKNKDKKEGFLLDKKSQRISDLKRFVADKSSN